MRGCRVCLGSELRSFLSLGRQPLANSFLTAERLDLPEPVYPLDVYFCESCGHVQLMDIVPAEELFSHYLYVSGTSDALRNHFTELAGEAWDRFLAGGSGLVVDIGSNDGTLLRCFQRHGVRVLGVEPAANIAASARATGVATVNRFFGEATAKAVAAEHGRAQVVTGANVFAHVDDLDDFVRGLLALVDDRGVAIIEVPYLVDLLDKLEFDTIYHEHVSYFAIGPLVRLFARFGMRVFDMRRVAIHGGSLRVFVTREAHAPPATERVGELLRLEAQRRVGDYETYRQFGARVEALRSDVLAFLDDLKAKGCRIAGYGAAAKANTLLNYCGIGTETLAYMVDKSPYKQGLYTPGSRIPVNAPEKLVEDRPNYVLILAWNFAGEIMQQQRRYAELGGRFIVPIPQPRIAA